MPGPVAPFDEAFICRDIDHVQPSRFIPNAVVWPCQCKSHADFLARACIQMALWRHLVCVRVGKEDEMLTKGALIVSVLTTLASAPVTLPVINGQPVEFALGPVSVELERGQRADFGLRPHCLAEDCPIIAIRVGEQAEPLYRITL